ncbi:MAG: DUF4231 domain-containing protein [Gammaproteobacteria bacterium]
MAKQEESQTTPPWMQLIENRKARADYYFDHVLSGQRQWYSDKAGRQKFKHLSFAISVIVLGALISLLQIVSGLAWVSGATAVLGASVSVLRAIDTLLRPNETWLAYRKAAEGMKREYRLYVNNAGDYVRAENEDAAYRLLVERVETVIAEEQQLYWQYHAPARATAEPESGDSGD